MTTFVYVNENIDQIKHLVKIGLVPCSIINHYYIYSRYDYYRRLENRCRESALLAARDSNVSERTVFRVIAKMETEI